MADEIVIRISGDAKGALAAISEVRSGLQQLSAELKQMGQTSFAGFAQSARQAMADMSAALRGAGGGGLGQAFSQATQELRQQAQAAREYAQAAQQAATQARRAYQDEVEALRLKRQELAQARQEADRSSQAEREAANQRILALQQEVRALQERVNAARTNYRDSQRAAEDAAQAARQLAQAAQQASQQERQAAQVARQAAQERAQAERQAAQAAQQAAREQEQAERQAAQAARQAAQERIQAERQAAREAELAAQRYQEAYQRAVQQIRTAIGALRELAGGIGLGILAGLGGAVKAFADFESEMNRVRALAGASTREVQDLSRAVLQLAAVSGRAPKELADGLYYIVSAGFKASEAMQILTAAVKAASAEHANLHVVADGLTSLMKAYGLAAGEAERVTDQMIVAVREGKLEFENLAGSVGRVAPMAKLAGLSLAEMLTTLTMLTRTGLSADEAATALRAALNNLEKPAKQTKAVLLEVGYTADQLRQAIKERGLISVIQELYDKTGGNLDLLGRIIPNIRGLTGVLSLATQGFGEYRRVLDEVEHSQGKTNEVFKQTASTLRFQFDQIKSSVQSAFITIGSYLAPAIEQVATQMGNLARRAAEYLRTNPEWAAHATQMAALLGATLALAGGVRVLSSALYLLGVSAGPLFVGLRSANLLFIQMLGPIGALAAAFVGIEAAARSNVPVLSQLAQAIRNLPDPVKITAIEMAALALALPKVVSAGQAVAIVVGDLVTRLRVFLSLVREFGLISTLTTMFSGWGIALAGVVAVVGALELSLRAFTGKGIIERLFSRGDPEVVKAVSANLEHFNQVLGQVRGTAEDAAATVGKALSILEGQFQQLDFRVKELQQHYQDFAQNFKVAGNEFAIAFEGVGAYAGYEEALKRIDDDQKRVKITAQSLKEEVSALLEQFHRAPESFSPMQLSQAVNQYIELLERLKRENKEAFDSAGLDELLKKLNQLRDAAARRLKIVDDEAKQDLAQFERALKQIAEEGQTAAGQLRRALGTVKETLTDLTTQIGETAKAIDQLGKAPTRELNDFAAVMAFLDVKASPVAAKLWTLQGGLQGMGPAFAGMVDRAYAAAAALGLVDGKATTTEQKLAALNDKLADGTRVIDAAAQAYQTVQGAFAQIGVSMNNLLPSFGSIIDQIRRHGIVLDDDTKRAFALAMAEGQLTTALQNNTGSLDANAEAAIRHALTLSDNALIAEKAKKDFLEGKITLDQYRQKIAEVATAQQEGRTASEGYASAQGKVASASDDAGKALAPLPEKLRDVGTAGQDAGGKIQTGAQTGSEALQALAGDATTSAATISTAGGTAGDGWAKEFVGKVETGTAESGKLMAEVGRDVDLGPRGAEHADSYEKGFTDHLGNAKDRIADAVRGLFGNIDLKDAGTTIASGIVNGMVQGLASGQGPIAGAALGLAGTIVSTIADHLGIRSPSEVFDDIGFMTAQGLAVGLTRGKEPVQAAATDLGTSAIEGVKKALDLLPQFIDTGFGEATDQIVAGIREVSAAISAAMAAIGGIGVSNAKGVGETAGAISAVFDALAKTVEVLNKIAALGEDFTPADADRLRQLVGLVEAAIGELFARTSAWNAFGVAHVKDAGDAAGAAMEALIKTVDVLSRVREIRPPSEADVTRTTTLVEYAITTVSAVLDRVNGVLAGRMARVGQIAPQVQALMDALKATVETLQKVRELGGVDATDSAHLAEVVTVAIDTLSQALDRITQEVPKVAASAKAVPPMVRDLFDALKAVADTIKATRELGTIAPGDFRRVGLSIVMAVQMLQYALWEIDRRLSDGAGRGQAALAATRELFETLKAVGEVIAQARAGLNPSLFEATLRDLIQVAIRLTQDATEMGREFTAAQQRFVGTVLPAVRAVFDTLKSVIDAFLAFSSQTTEKQRSSFDQVSKNAQAGKESMVHAEEEIEKSFTDFRLADRLRAKLPAIEQNLHAAIEIARHILDAWVKEFQNFEIEGKEAAMQAAEAVRSVSGALKDVVDLLMTLGTEADPREAWENYVERVKDLDFQLQEQLAELQQQEYDAFAQFAEGGLKDEAALGRTLERINRQKEAAIRRHDFEVQKLQNQLAREQARQQREDPKEKIRRGIDNLRKLLDDILGMIRQLAQDFESKIKDDQEKLGNLFTLISKFVSTLKQVVEVLSKAGDKLDEDLPRAQKILDHAPDFFEAIRKALDQILQYDYDADETKKKLSLFDDIVRRIIQMIRTVIDTLGGDEKILEKLERAKVIIAAMPDILQAFKDMSDSIINYDVDPDVMVKKFDMFEDIIKRLLKFLALAMYVVDLAPREKLEPAKEILQRDLEDIINAISDRAHQVLDFDVDADAIQKKTDDIVAITKNLIKIAMLAAKFGEVITDAKDKLKDFKENVEKVFTDIADGFKAAADKIMNEVIPQVQNYINALDLLIQKLIEAMQKLSRAISMINAMKSMASSAKSGGGGGGGSAAAPPNHAAQGIIVTRMAMGGIVQRYAGGTAVVQGPTLALIGEDGDEAVLPLTKAERFWGILGQLASMGKVPPAGQEGARVLAAVARASGALTAPTTPTGGTSTTRPATDQPGYVINLHFHSAGTPSPREVAETFQRTMWSMGHRLASGIG